MPQSWKDANITPVPKQNPIHDVNKHLRPISLTPVLSKVAEDFVVESFLKPVVLAKVDVRQFGTVPGSSTTQALISMVHCPVADSVLNLVRTVTRSGGPSHQGSHRAQNLAPGYLLL